MARFNNNAKTFMKKINANNFKSGLSKFATGVTIVTINYKDLYIGKTINSFASLSLNPPLVLFSLDIKSTSLNKYLSSKFLGINILAKKQKIYSNYFSKSNPKWENIKYYLAPNKIPMITEACVNLYCEKSKTLKQGDHIIFICKINKININEKSKPLIYSNNHYI